MIKKVKIPQIMVIGSGSWGTALANLMANNGYDVFIHARRLELVNEINSKHQNSQYLPHITLHQNLKAGININNEADYVFIVVPSDQAHDIFKKIASENFKKNCIFVICSKGFDNKTYQVLSDSFAEIVGTKNYVVLSGPNFAIEVAKQMPTITTIASKNKKVAQKVIKILDNSNFKAQYFNDPRTAEICGIVKNILAIGCGIIDGLELGFNAKSALVAKGINEIQLICKKINASTNINNPAGFGDIFLTCASNKSRNNSFGIAIVNQQKSVSNINQGLTLEGVKSAKIIVDFAKKHNLNLALCEAIARIVHHKYSVQEIKSLLINAIIS